VIVTVADENKRPRADDRPNSEDRRLSAPGGVRLPSFDAEKIILRRAIESSCQSPRSEVSLHEKKRFLNMPGGEPDFNRPFFQRVEKTFSQTMPGGLDAMASMDDEDGEQGAGMRRRPVTLRDVARSSGVSVATASKALNQSGRMTEKTRTRVRETALRMGFRPNSLAQSLLSRRSFTVGLLTNDTYGRFSLPLMAGVAEALLDNGVSIFLCNVEDDPRLGQLHVEAMLDKQVDGIIATGKRIDRRLPVDLANLGVPVIYAFTQPDPNAIAFVSDDSGGARMAVERLIHHGRRRIAHISGPASFSVVHARAQACADVLGEHGLACRPPLLGPWTEAWGHEAVGRLFAPDGDRPDALFCGNDQIARGAVDALRERGVGVPDDVAVIGFDNWEVMAAATRPPLTTVDMNLSNLGQQAGQTLLSLIDGQPVEPGIRKLPCRLVIRRSCGSP
jgi:LacI family transcriptional regulator